MAHGTARTAVGAAVLVCLLTVLVTASDTATVFRAATPLVSPPTGTLITVQTALLSNVTAVTVGTVAVPYAYTCFLASQVCVFNISIPASAVPGYRNLSIVYDGGTQTARNDSIVFYASVCASEGWYYAAASNSCVSCANWTGAYCPGGARVWPQPGYWARNESTFVGAA